MSLRTAWRPLDRETVRSAPDRVGVYELGDEEGNSLGLAVGVLRDELKEELAYGGAGRRSDADREAPGGAAKVRWRVANSRRHAERLLEDLR